MSRRHLRAALAVVLAFAAPAVGGVGSAAGDEGGVPAARPGSLVGTFGEGGILRLEPGAGKENAGEALAVDSAGRPLLLSTDGDGGSRLVRLGEDGATESTLALPAGTWEDVAVDAAGRIVLAGTAEGKLAVARLGADGAPDPSFGSGGVAVLGVGFPGGPGNFESTKESLSRLVALPDGGIVAAGILEGCYANCYIEDEVVARFTAAGAPDPSFGTGGAYVADFGARYKGGEGSGQGFSALAVEADGKVLLGGTDGWKVTVLRLTAAGAPDTAFGRAGYFSSDYETEGEEGYYKVGDARALLLEQERIVVVGDRFLYGLRPDGRLDPGFGRKGHASVAPPALSAESDQTGDALIDAAGRIVVVGAGGSSTMERYSPAGHADARFGHGGLAEARLADGRAPEGPFGEFTPAESLESVVQLPGGDLLAAGYAYRGDQDARRQATVLRRNDLAGRLARCDGKPVVYQGTPGPDQIPFIRGPVATFGGNDTIHGGSGDLCTGPGNDFVKGRTGGTMLLGAGDDRAQVGSTHVRGGAGDDIIRLGGGLTTNIDAAGGPGNDLLVGSDDRDHLSGGPGDDRLYGLGGRDVLRGGPGDDLLSGGTADDVLDGGPGQDQLLPGTGSPPSLTYSTSSKDFRLRIVIRHRTVTGIHLRVVTDCGDGTQNISTSGESDLHVPIRHGRFVEGSRIDLGGWEITHLTGRVYPDRIVGTYFESVDEEDSDHNHYTCATGPVGHRGPLHYVARRASGGKSGAAGRRRAAPRSAARPALTRPSAGRVFGAIAGPRGTALVLQPGRTGVAVARYLPDGKLDRSFGQDGFAFDPRTNFYLEGHLAAGPDGTIVASSSEGITAFTAAGKIDRAYGREGQIKRGDSGTDIGLATNVVLGNGATIALSPNFDPHTPPGIIAVRYRPDGRLDRGYGKNGRAFAPLSNDYYEPVTATMPQGGRLLLLSPGEEEGELFLTRLTRDGRVDQSYGSDGLVGAYNVKGRPIGMVRQPGGAIVVATSANQLVRFTPAGERDRAFGSRGVVTGPAPHTFLHALVQTPDGGLIVAGSATEGRSSASPSALAVERFTATGAPDPAYGAGAGYVVRSIGPEVRAGVRAAVLLPGEGLFLAGQATNLRAPPFGARILLAGLEADGDPTPSFGTEGVVVTDTISRTPGAPGESR